MSKNMHMIRRDRPVFAISDDRVMLEQILKAHSPDMFTLEVEDLLGVVQDIFYSPVPTMDDQAALTSHTFKEYGEHSPFGDFVDLIDQILCEIECKCLRGTDNHFHGAGSHDGQSTATFSILNLVSRYRWDSKLVLILSALAAKYGVFLLIAQTYTTNQLTKSVAFIKQLPQLLHHPGMLSPRLEKVRVLMKDMTDLTKTIIEIYQLPVQYITHDFTDRIPIAVYWTIRSVLTCASQISSISSFEHDQIVSFTETTELNTGSERLRKINEHLRSQLSHCHQEIERIREEKDYDSLMKTIEETIHLDITTPLTQLLRPITTLYHGERSQKKRVNIDVLRRKDLLLFISDLDSMQDELFILELIYGEAWQQSEMYFEIMWIPVLDHVWSENDKNKFEQLQEMMKWYVVSEPWLINRAAIKYIKEQWHLRKKPILVALNPRGQVACKNAFPMVWIWQGLAYPFTSSRERDLWKEQAWDLEFLVDGTDQTTLNWIGAGKYVCLYGGEDIEGIRKFTKAVRKFAVDAEIQLEMVYVGKRQPKERVRRIMDTIKAENLSHCLLEVFHAWYFWVRIEGMWESRHQALKHGQTQKVYDEAYENDRVMSEIKQLLSYGGSGEGWALIGKATEERMIIGKWEVLTDVFLKLEDYKYRIEKEGVCFPANETKTLIQPPHHCNQLVIPSSSGMVPDKVVCHECGRPMDKFFMYKCCIDD